MFDTDLAKLRVQIIVFIKYFSLRVFSENEYSSSHDHCYICSCGSTNTHSLN